MLSPGQPIYVILYSVDCFFCFFYTALVFQQPRYVGEPEKWGIHSGDPSG